MPGSPNDRPAPPPTVEPRPVVIDTGAVRLYGDLALPTDARGLVVFAHGSGSSRLSPRNRSVAARINEAGLGTLLFDLLTVEEGAGEEAGGMLRFDIGLLGRRLIDVTDWLAANPDTEGLPLGYFGASTGAAAALVAAAERSDRVRAVVSRGGRPDLAAEWLPRVESPVLLIVGGNDEPVIGMNRRALEHLTGAAHHLEVIPGATHLFEEPGALEAVALLAVEWFRLHLFE